ncbi:serine hydrolase domain-containing protein [Streptomyces sp. NPDC087851]|uniref:serine hydrolase domain-containing protein n=1 Tax=Streptomyces sp. NPDC087851 TaxID=3365810 RepID=UPI0038075056
MTSPAPAVRPADGGGEREPPPPPPPAWARAPADALARAACGACAVVVALRRGEERAVVPYGTTAFGGGEPVTADTRFEIGSLTKCFTALLLAEQAARGEVAYGDPLSRFLPPEALPQQRGAPITLLHLATHTAGLPRLPPGLLAGAASHWFSNPYAAFSTEDLLRSLARTRPGARPGDRVRYSNFGVGLLGHLLTRAAPDGPEYGELLAERVLGPLGLHGTGSDPGLPQATGHWHGRPRPSWRIPGLPGAGALRSSAPDLLALLDALADGAARGAAADGPLGAALTEAVRPRLALRGGTRRLALVWNIRVRPEGAAYHHSGGTRGFTAFAGFVPERRTAVVALANTTPAVDQAFLQLAYTTLVTLHRRG